MIYHFLQNRNFPEQMYLFSKHKCLVSLEMESLPLLRVALSLVKHIMICFFCWDDIFNIFMSLYFVSRKTTDFYGLVGVFPTKENAA